MKAWTLVVFAVAVASAALPGVAHAGVPTADQAAAVERLQAVSTTPVSAEFAAGSARFVAATVPVDSASPAEQAYAFLESFRDLYGLASPREQLHVVREAGEGDDRSVFFGQSAHGVPVEDAQLAVHILGGSVVATNGAYLPLQPKATKPVLSAEEATAVVRRSAGRSDEAVEPAELTYFNASLTMNEAEREAWGLDEATHLAWRVELPTRSSVVDAQTGRELLGSDPVDEAATDLSISSDSNVGPGWYCSWPGATEWFDEHGLRPGAMPDGEGFAARDAVNDTYDYFRSTFGRRSFDGADALIRVTLDVPLSVFKGQENAGYNHQCHDFYFTDGLALKDVVAHEFTHAITHYTANLRGTNQQGALNEHYSDFFAAMIDPNWTIGEGSASGSQRDMSNPPRFSQPDNMGSFVTTTDDDGGVHVNDGIPNKVAFLITAGGSFRTFQITGLGHTKAERLYYKVLTQRLTWSSDFAAQRNATVLQAAQWAATGTNGFTAADACNVRNAFAAAGLGEGDRDCDGIGDFTDTDNDRDGIPDAADNCPLMSNASQLDTDSDRIGDACDPDDDDDGVPDLRDKCVLVPNADQGDNDADGVGNACDATPNGDADIDGVDDLRDNCKGVWNPDQRDDDRDGVGNACDTFPDTDRDGVQNVVDNCPTIANQDQSDRDGDGVGDVCDNAPTVPNYDQADTDRDGVPDVLDSDDDGDGIADAADNCQLTPNPSQEDTDRNGIGDACEYVLDPTRDLHQAFVARDQYFERLQILVDPCIPECGPPGGLVKATIDVKSDHQLELRLLDAGGEVIATGVSGEPLTFEATIGDDGRVPRYRLEILPSPEFEPGNEYPFTASMSDPMPRT
jgi:Zn-dependent metalloprotease